MGNGRWTEATYRGYAADTGYRTKTVHEVFANYSMPDGLNPARIVVRESCDSVANPASTPVILGLDVTGSMGKYAREIAVNHLPKLMNGILEERPVTDPHLMFMGIDDVHAQSRAPLQMSQFEADIKILEQLREICMVGGGGGNRSESYDAVWYGAAHKTKIDSYDRRQMPGFIFTFGDEEAPYQSMSSSQLKSIFGEGEYPATITPVESLSAAQEKYQVFHVVIEQGSYCYSRLKEVRSSCTELLGNNVIFLRDTEYLSEVVLATLHIANGKDMESVIAASSNADELRYAFANSLPNEGG